jgi:5'-methylthioadenosine phosphorylase
VIGIIGGSGLYAGFSELTRARETVVDTAHGTVKCTRALLDDSEVVFLSRHGNNQLVPPHRVPYKAHMKAMKQLGVTRILATSAVGALRPEIPLGCLALPDQFIDFTRETRTFYEGGDSGLVHLDLSEPFCPDLRALLHEAGTALGLDVRSGGVYTCIDGPHFETLAEARMLCALGGTLAGMTAVPEAKLARELEICYQVAAIPVDYPAQKEGEVSHAQTLRIMAESTEKVVSLFKAAIGRLPEQRTCACSKALDGFPH